MTVAAELLASGRPGDVTLTAVAERAGVSKGTLYLYFSSREALFGELGVGLVVRRLDAIEAAIRRDLALRGPESLATLLAREFAGDSATHSVLPSLSDWLCAAPPEIADAQRAALRLSLERLGSILADRLPPPTDAAGRGAGSTDRDSPSSGSAGLGEGTMALWIGWISMRSLMDSPIDYPHDEPSDKRGRESDKGDRATHHRDSQLRNLLLGLYRS